MAKLTANGRIVHYTDAGEGQPLLLLHASSGSSAQWRRLSDMLLAQGGWRVLAVDLQGYGESSRWDVEQPLRLEDEFGPLRAILAAAGGGPFHLVGHSYGAMIALRFAMAKPSPPLASLALIEPVAFWLLKDAGEQALYAEARGVAETYMQAFDAGNLEAAAQPYIDYWSGAGAWAGMPEGLRNYVLATAGKARREWDVGLGQTEIGARLADLRAFDCRTLLMRGARSTAPTRRIMDVLHGAMPGSRLVEIPEAGHMAPLTHARLVNAELVAHLNSA